MPETKFLVVEEKTCLKCNGRSFIDPAPSLGGILEKPQFICPECNGHGTIVSKVKLRVAMEEILASLPAVPIISPRTK